MSHSGRIVVKDESSRAEVARGYYLRLDWPLAYQPSKLTKTDGEPKAIPMHRQADGSSILPVADLELSVAGTIKTLIKINGVEEVRVYPANCFLVVLSVGYDWKEVDPVILETLSQSLELGPIDRVDYDSWRRNNMPRSINPLDSVEYKSSLNKQSRLIERLINNSAEKAAEPAPEVTARMWPEDYPPGSTPPPTLCSD